jgi:putative MFS transporter
MSLGSFLTAFAPSALAFVAIQIVTRSFIIAAAITSFVVVSEEFPAAHRGWGIGILAGVGAIGFGFGALLYGFVNQLPFGWRALYALGVFPLFFLPSLARGLRETARFTATAGASATPLGGGLWAVVELFKRHPRRALALAAIGALANVGMAPSFQFISDFLQTERGWTPGAFAALSVCFGAFAIIGNPVAGRLGDRYGRRTIAAVVFAVFPLASFGFFAGPAGFVAVPWTAMVFLSMASSVCVRALATELFTTSLRGASGGSLVLLETMGAGFGLLIAYPLAMSTFAAGQSIAIPLIALVCLGAAGSVFLVPETARRELEEI